MKDIKKQMILAELIQKELDGCLTDQEFSLLGSMLKEDNEAVIYYVKTIRAISAFSSNSIIPSLETVETGKFRLESFESGIWKALSEAEKKAPAVPIPPEKPAEEHIQKVERQNIQIRINRGSLITLLLSVAAVLLFALIIHFVPKKTGIEVATLTDSITAKWADAQTPMNKGMRLVTGSTGYLLREGIVQIEFDNQARVTIESPAEFEILTGDQVKLNYGRLYATVPQGAIGFAVQTPSARIIDLGTEFGIDASTLGDTNLHVMKGKTTLIAGEKSDKISMEISSHTARRILRSTGKVSEIPCDENLFARFINSETKLVWRGQKLDLADIVRQGNGLGTGNSAARLNPLKGFTTDQQNGFATAKGYLSLSGKLFIDGIFVPNGSDRQVVSSRGDVFEECPTTSSLFDMDLLANPEPELLKTDLRDGTIRFDHETYANGGKTCILMHSNLGITFDLNAIRRAYPFQITRFVSRVGIADLHETCSCNADFWVLLDGKVCYSLRQYKQKGVLNDVSVEIKDTDRFLTLVTTDGGDKDSPKGEPHQPEYFYNRAISCDWCVFTEPVLVLE